MAKRLSQTWTTQDKRTLQISEITLDHLLNIVHDSHFRVARMRTNAISALGGLDNANINPDTRGAFLNVRPADVFPAWPTIIRYTRRRFEEKFGFGIGEARDVVFKAWASGEVLDTKYEEAVRFLLCDSAKTVPPRLTAYVTTFRPGTDEQYRVMCWNLRRDQPVIWRQLSNTSLPLVKVLPTIPPNRLCSALNFVKPKNVWDGTDIMDDIPFYAGR